MPDPQVNDILQCHRVAVPESSLSPGFVVTLGSQSYSTGRKVQSVAIWLPAVFIDSWRERPLNARDFLVALSASSGLQENWRRHL